MAVKARPIGRIDGNTNFATRDFIVTSGETVTQGDFVYLSGGYLSAASPESADILVGMALKTVVGDGTLTCPVCIDPQMQYLVDNDNDTTTFAVTHVGTYFQLIGATGAQYIDTSTTHASTGQLVFIEYNPQIDPVRSDTSWGIFVIVCSFLQNYVNVA